MALSIRARLSLPHSQYPPSGSFHKPLILQNENHKHRKVTKLITWIIAWSNSVKLWAMPYKATQNGQVMVKSFNKMWSTGEGNGKLFQYSHLENPMNSVKRKKTKDMTLKDEFTRSEGTQYATREEWRNSFRRKEEAEPSGNNAQLQTCQVVKVKSGAVKNNIAWEPGMLGLWVKVNWKWSNRRWQEWTLKF